MSTTSLFFLCLWICIARRFVHILYVWRLYPAWNVWRSSIHFVYIHVHCLSDSSRSHSVCVCVFLQSSECSGFLGSSSRTSSRANSACGSPVVSNFTVTDAQDYHGPSQLYFIICFLSDRFSYSYIHPVPTVCHWLLMFLAESVDGDAFSLC